MTDLMLADLLLLLLVCPLISLGVFGDDVRQ